MSTIYLLVTIILVFLLKNKVKVPISSKKEKKVNPHQLLIKSLLLYVPYVKCAQNILEVFGFSTAKYY